MITISLDETYHVKNNKPLYDTRYKKVMSFHNGIAPVEDEKGAFFIDINNNKLFNRIFEKAYGFYEGKAAVKDKSGWFHIDTNGNDVYENRYSWVGNFNENRCVVRDFDDNYFHIDENGKRVYKHNYKYVGDFKYGIAVVIDDSGKSTHIDKFGNLLHGKYFDELNIFHKGFAVAKDEKGYFHINKKGEAIYSQRYQKLEDFYNGYALATTFDGNKVVLNESDFSELKITEPQINKNKVLDDVFSYFEYQILFAILKLDILKNIKNFKKLKLPEVSKKLIYRWLISKKIIDKNFNLTSFGKVIENELKDIILYWRDLPFKTSAYMIETIKKGDEFFSELFGKKYFDFLEDNQEYRILSQKINSYYGKDYNLLLSYLNLKNELVCDIGGGNEKLAKKIKEFYPDVKIIIADKFIKNEDNFHIKIDFFKEFNIKSDVFIMSRVLHDWNDERALLILKNIAKNMRNNTKLYLFETIVPDNYQDIGITLSFHLLNFLGGYERSLEDFEFLLYQANLKIIDVKTEGLISLIKVMKK